MPKKSRAASRILLVHFEGPSLSGESLDACPRHGADELGNVCEPGFGGGGPPDGDRLASLHPAQSPRVEGPGLGESLLVPGNHRGERTLPSGRDSTRRPRPPARSARRVTARPEFRMHWSASPSRSRTPDTHKQPRASRARGERRTAASSGYHRGRKGISWEAVQKLLRHMVQGTANGCFGQVRQRYPPIAVVCQLGIERDGPEARDPEICGLG